MSDAFECSNKALSTYIIGSLFIFVIDVL